MPDHPVHDTVTAPRPRFQRLRERLAGHPADTTLRRDIPAPLEPVLRHWIRLACQHDADAAQRVALRLDIAPTFDGRPGTFSFLDAICNVSDNPDVLDVIDGLLAVHRAPTWFGDDRLHQTAENYGHLVGNLVDALDDAGSAYTVASDLRALVERVDPTVAAAIEHTIDAASPTAGGLLRDAWRHAYGLHPDPTAAYREAVRAVEEVACPLVLEKAAEKNSATLGTVSKHLRDAPDKWQFVLLDKNDAGSVDTLVAMLDRLWTGQVSRHGGGRRSRDQTQTEAEAAVHLAATLVQLLNAGALVRRSSP